MESQDFCVQGESICSGTYSGLDVKLWCEQLGIAYLPVFNGGCFSWNENGKKILNRAINKAKQSISKFKISALGFNRNNICVMARTNKPKINRAGGGDHAEQLIMYEAKRRGIVKILICRVGKSGKLLPIQPCKSCKEIAQKLNIIIESINT